MYRKINYSFNGYYNDLSVEVKMNDNVKIEDRALNKALMIAVNYLIENITIDEQESAE